MRAPAALPVPWSICALGWAVFLAGCAYVGDPLPPAMRIPAAVTDLKAVQRGGQIYIEYTLPALTTEGLAIRDRDRGAEEIRIGTTPAPWNIEQWAAQSSGAAKIEPAAAWVGKDVAMAVRTANARGRFSEWSNPVTLTITPPLARPSSLQASPVAQGVELRWTGDATAFRIFRDGVLLGESSSASYVDVSTHFGTAYVYQVQGTNGAAESEPSTTVTITPEDRFPPERPSRVTALAGAMSIELSWDRGAAADLAFFQLYRDGELLADKLTAATYSDTAVQPGRTYRYTVTAVDKSQNASAHSAVVEIQLP